MRPLFSPVVIERGDTRLVRHMSETDAFKEAERLARLHPGKAFCVFLPVQIVMLPETPVRVDRVHGGYECDIPF